MKGPQLEERNPKEIQGAKPETARSISECGDSSPLCIPAILPPQRKCRQVGALHTLARLRGVLALLLVGAVAACGQPFSLDWFTMDGGGGTSTGGVYSVSGTIGQPDAGTMSGGNITVHGGFWGLMAAAQRSGAPHLTVTGSNNTVTISWPAPAPGWVLEWTNALPQSAVPWPQIAPPYATNGTNVQFTEPSPTGHKFYRLRKP